MSLERPGPRAAQPDPSQQVEYYNQWLAQGGDYEKEAKARGWQIPELVYKELERSIVPGQKLLDVGCGTGLSAEPFKNSGLAMHGIDGSEALLKAANEKKTYSLGTEQMLIGRDEPRAAHTYDFAISFGTMNIIPAARTELIGFLQKSVKPGGIIAFNYLDPEDYSKKEIIPSGANDYIEKDTMADNRMTLFFHRRQDVIEACDKLNLAPIKEIKTIAYPLREAGRQDPTRIMIARYTPQP